jgi:hypothetical protein
MAGSYTRPDLGASPCGIAIALIASAMSGSNDPLVSGGDVPEHLLSALPAIIDPRRRRGVRHQLVAVLQRAALARLPPGSCNRIT